MVCALVAAFAQEAKKWQGKFEQLQSELPTPSDYRNAAGAPGVRYWQQKADYIIAAELNDENQTITGSETITYYNNSPDVLKYLWLQLDQNILTKGNMTRASQTGTLMNDTLNTLQLFRRSDPFDGGHKIKTVKDASGNALSYFVNNTMMRVDLSTPMKTGDKFTFSVDWWYNIGNRQIDGQRSGLGVFP